MLAQIADRTQSALRRREQHGRVPAHDQNGLAARRHCDIAAHDREIEWPSSSAREDSAKFSFISRRGSGKSITTRQSPSRLQ
jgi:hypothetical protein